jgi:3,4-dihydroxy 2-butanone 4-phosphate synthase/GTP cyclohydrolase II
MTLNQQIEQWLQSNKQHFRAVTRPFVTLSFAQSLDGSIAINSGASLPLSGPESTCLTHQLRSLHDGILVGISTVLTDNPQLSVREWNGPDPQPIVLDSHLRMPASARLWQTNKKRCWVLTTAEESAQENMTVESTVEGTAEEGTGPEILNVQRNDDGRVCLTAAMQLLYNKGIRSLMVEGGANVITAFLRARLADALVLTVAPRLVGGYKAVSDLNVEQAQPFPALTPLFSARSGDDLIIWGNLRYGDDNV